MATQAPVTVSSAWTSVFVGAFTGAIQNVGNTPLVANVQPTGSPPAAGAGGFAVYNTAVSVAVGASETLWVRSVGATGVVVLA